MPDMSEVVEVQIDGPFPFGGKLKGKGQLTIQIGDATQMEMSVNYKPDGRLILGLGATTGISLRTDSSLKFSGGLTHDLMNRDLTGGFVGIKLKIGSRVSAKVLQSFQARTGSATSVTLRVQL